MKKFLALILLILAVALLAVALLQNNGSGSSDKQPLTVFCAAGVKQPGENENL